MDEVEKFYATYNNWRHTFRLALLTNSSIWTGTRLRILDGRGKVIADRQIAPEDISNDEERERLRQAVHERARRDLEMWLSWKYDKYGFKPRLIRKEENNV